MPCTPTPPPVGGSQEWLLSQWLADYEGADWYTQWQMTADVCAGLTQLLHPDHTRIECREEWPNFVQAFCATPPPEPPPPGPPPCTPTPPPQHDADSMSVPDFLSFLAHHPDEERDEILSRVCSGLTILTRDGVAIACQEDWPDVVREHCGSTGLGPEFVPLGQPGSEIEATGSMTQEWRKLWKQQLELRTLGRTAWAAAGHLFEWRTGRRWPARSHHRR